MVAYTRIGIWEMRRIFVVMSSTQVILAIISGGIVGFALGLLGGGGSILAVPLLFYVVGIHDPHIVIGTTALAVSVNAYLNLIPHAKAKHVAWKPAIAFALPGMIGALIGSEIGKHVPDKEILFLFAILMVVIAVLMLRPRKESLKKSTEITGFAHPIRIIGTGFAVGFLSGFFGIGGGFLIVPGLVFSTGMSLITAIGSSLFSVGTFGLTTSINYALSGLINWWIVIEYVGGGLLGGVIGTIISSRLSKQKRALNIIFAVIIFCVAVYMLIINFQALWG